MKHLNHIIFYLTLFFNTNYCENINNIDTKFVILFKNKQNSANGKYFGLTVAAIKRANLVQVLIGAPRDQLANNAGVNRTGAVFGCEWSEATTVKNRIVNCNQINFNLNGDTKTNKMFLGGSLLANGSEFISCAYMWSNPDLNYNPSGKCYIVNNNGQVISNLNFGSSDMIGFSLASLSDQSILFGAPTRNFFTGTIFKRTKPLKFNADLRKLNSNNNDNENDNRIADHSYFGYAITTGYFYNKAKEYIAVSAPRNNYFNGAVYLFSANVFYSEDIRISTVKQVIKSKNKEEYFGSSILAVDVNNDGLTDLIIGAPLYSAGNQREIGRIAVYTAFYTTSQNAITFWKEIFGHKYASRFGSTLSSIDLNLDTYKDVVIGAPYEANEDSSTGAVYIYYGSNNGLQNDSFLRIGSENIELNSIKLRGFGISIVSNVDFDDNGYEDLLIGSYASEHATLLRVKPLAKFEITVKFKPPKVKLGDRNCMGKQNTCFNLTFCVNIAGKYLTDTQSALITLTVSDRNLRAREVRAVINTQSNTKTIEVKGNRNKCFEKEMFAIAFTGAAADNRYADIRTPIEFNLTAQLNNALTNDKFCKNCGISQTYTNFYDIEFEHGCHKMRCVADLKLTVETKNDNMIKDDDISVLIEGYTIDMDISVANTGNASLNTILVIHITPQLLELKDGGNSKSCNKNQTELNYVCIVNKILDQNKKQILDLHFITNHVQTNRTDFNFTITSDSDIRTPQIQFRHFEIWKRASLRLRGDATNTNYSYNHNTESVPFSVKYALTKDGPSTINSSFLYLLLPEPIIALDKESQKICIKVNEANKYNVNVDSNNTINLVCDSNANQCSKYKCKLDKLNSGANRIPVVISAVLLTEKLKHVSDYSTLKLFLWSEILVEDKFTFESEVSAHTLTTVSFAYRKSAMDKRVELWILFVSAGSAIIILLIISIVLINYGFFRRKTREELIKVKQRYSMKPDDTLKLQSSIEDFIDENDDNNNEFNEIN